MSREKYSNDTNGNYVIFDSGDNLICGYDSDDFGDMVRDYPNAEKEQRATDFDWGDYNE